MQRMVVFIERIIEVLLKMIRQNRALS